MTPPQFDFATSAVSPCIATLLYMQPVDAPANARSTNIPDSRLSRFIGVVLFS